MSLQDNSQETAPNKEAIRRTIDRLKNLKTTKPGEMPPLQTFQEEPELPTSFQVQDDDSLFNNSK